MRTRKQTTRFGTLALSGLLLLASQAALSQDRQPPRDSDVSYKTIDIRDVDVSTEQGARWLYRKIVAAATSVCFGSVERRGVQWFSTQLKYARRCFDDSVNSALASVNAATGLDIEQLAGLDRYDEALASR